MNDKHPATLVDSVGQAPIDKWWIAIDGKADGPHSSSFIAFLLKEGRISLTTKVCSVGNNAWIPLRDAEEIVAAIQAQSPGGLPPRLAHAEETISEKAIARLKSFTNPALPWFANWICIYAILVTPALVVLDLILKIVGFNSAADLMSESPVMIHAVAIDTISFFVDVVIVTGFVIGGLQLRNLQRKGVVLLKAGFVASLFWGMLMLVVSVLWDTIVTLSGQAPPSGDETSAGAVWLFLLLLLVCLGILIFEIVALVWLVNNEHRLPLDASAPAEDDALRQPDAAMV